MKAEAYASALLFIEIPDLLKDIQVFVGLLHVVALTGKLLQGLGSVLRAFCSCFMRATSERR